MYAPSPSRGKVAPPQAVTEEGENPKAPRRTALQTKNLN